MALKVIRYLICGLLVLSISACSSVDTQDEESMMALDGESSAAVEGESEGEDLFEDVAGEEGAEEEMGGDEVAQEEGGDELEEDFGDEFSEEPVAEEQAQEEVTPEEVAVQELPQEEQLAPVDEFVEEPAAVAFDSPQTELRKINFLANDNGGTVVIEASGDPSYTTRMNAETNQFVIEIQNSILPSKLKRPYILKDFETEFAGINAYQTAGSNVSRVVLQLKSGVEPVVQKEGNSILIIPSSQGMAQKDAEVGEPAVAAGGKKHEAWMDSYDQEMAEKYKILGARTLDEFLLGDNRFFGRPISIEINDANIRDVISFIARKSGANIVVSDDVKGKLTLKLREVPWDQALVIVMRSKNLGYIRQGSVIRISSLNKLREETDAAARIIATQRDLVPLKVKVFPVSYAKVKDLATKIKPFLSPKRGQIVEDGRTSTVIVTDLEEVLDRVGRLIRELDIPPAQVMIEGKIIEASEEFKRQIGVNWGMTGTPIEISGDGGYNGAPINLHPSLGIKPFSDAVVQTGTGIIGMQMGVLSGAGTLSASLAVAQSDNLVKIISSPRIVTTNKEKAEINQAGEVLAKTSTITNGTVETKIERTPVELKLQVTPQITADGSVIMDVDLRRQFAGPVEDQETLARAVQTRAAKTQVLVKNGQTAVIGGVFQSDNSENETGVPGLKNVPVIGWLFKGKIVERVKNELMIFLTPRILNAKDQKAADDTSVNL